MRLLLVLAVVVSLHTCLRAQSMDLDHAFGGSLTAPVPLDSVNSPDDDYSPRWDPVSQSLTFTSQRSGYAAVFVQRPTGSVEPIRGSFNQYGTHRAFVTFSAEGDALGVAYAAYPDQTYASIVTVPREGESVNLGNVCSRLNGRFFASHPSLSPDGTRIVYVTDRPGGTGGLDMWTSERTEDLQWSDPTILGNSVNTVGDEITPFLLASDTLVFASNGHGGEGGFDIFYSVFRNGAWQEPVPMDWLNTEFDESDCAVLPGGTQVFASTRPGGRGGLDIWIARRRP